MYQRYYDGYGQRQNEEFTEIISNETLPEKICTTANIQSTRRNDGLLSSLNLDDILLIGILLVMLNDDCDDKLMLIIIGFLFVSGLN